MTPEIAHFIKSELERDWRVYRSFGPWWWLIKAWLRKHDVSVGDYLDPQARAWFSLPEWTLQNAFEHHRESIMLGRGQVQQTTTPDGFDNYVLHDPDMEP